MILLGMPMDMQEDEVGHPRDQTRRNANQGYQEDFAGLSSDDLARGYSRLPDSSIKALNRQEKDCSTWNRVSAHTQNGFMGRGMYWKRNG